MNLRRLASLSMLSAAFGLMMVSSTGCVVRGRSGAHVHGGKHTHHHCHNKSRTQGRQKCHTHSHPQGHHP